MKVSVRFRVHYLRRTWLCTKWITLLKAAYHCVCVLRGINGFKSIWMIRPSWNSKQPLIICAYFNRFSVFCLYGPGEVSNWSGVEWSSFLVPRNPLTDPEMLHRLWRNTDATWQVEMPVKLEMNFISCLHWLSTRSWPSHCHGYSKGESSRSLANNQELSSNLVLIMCTVTTESARWRVLSCVLNAQWHARVENEGQLHWILARCLNVAAGALMVVCLMWCVK